ncbi:helix-turn-helix transcriptional regulator [Streptomyces hygroscopicus]|uniref:helix-turn-helix transcriptional regulator n=1 Tax=Streptomyces hygroscopicus TaxID=1912 RepID=UPI00078629F9|nr:YafY family protein [Streptomyces hygroscopicus]
MNRPTARVLALLEILQAGGTRTVAELADRLGVDERTVRRYIGHLIDLDVPVRSVRGRYGGYRLAPGYRMPPLMLTDEEALAVLLGLVAGRRAGLVTTSVAAAESAAAKVRRVLPEALGRRLDALLATADFTAPARPVVVPGTDVLLMFAEAARDRRPVAIGYTGWKGRRSERTVHPYGIVAHSGRWYVTGADSASGEVRMFRLDRIETAMVLPGSFEVPEGFDPAARVLSGLAGVPYLHEVSLRVRGTVDQVRHRLPPGLATVTELPAGSARETAQAAAGDARPAGADARPGGGMTEHAPGTAPPGGTTEHTRGTAPPGSGTADTTGDAAQHTTSTTRPADGAEEAAGGAAPHTGGAARHAGPPAGAGEGEGGGWVRVRLRAERLEWVPSVLAWLDLPFVIEYPDALRDHVHALARRLATGADTVLDGAEGARTGGAGTGSRPA